MNCVPWALVRFWVMTRILDTRNIQDMGSQIILSPFVFVIVMEALRKMITATVDRGLLSSFFVGSRPPAVNISLVVRR